MDVIDTGQAITAPVGDATLGRILNVLGEPVDEMGPVEADERWPIHRHAPSFEHLEPVVPARRKQGVALFEGGALVE